MKIGLLTYHSSGSYGATLQTYATCKILQMLGHDVELIDFRLDKKSSIPYKIAFWWKDYNTRKLWKRIYPKKSKYYPDMDALQDAILDYDCLMVGSDQTWNPEISRERCLAYFLNFGAENIKRISYASSFGVAVWPNKYKSLIPEIKRLLERFESLSTREESGQRLLNEVFGYNAEIVIDPTFLIEDFSKLSGPVNENGMLNAFIMNRSSEQLKRVLELGKYLKKKPVMTSTIYPYKGFSYRYPPTIGRWLRYIGGADFVVVDSFHALVFCLKYHRQFVVITPDNGRNSRLQTLLHITDLDDRFYYDNDNAIPYDTLINNQIPYEKVEKRLNAEKRKSLMFLKNCLK